MANADANGTGRTIEEMMEAERKAHAEYEATTTFKGYTIAFLRRIMDMVQDRDHWKNPWAASVSHHLVREVMIAVEFFHADRAETVGIEPLTGRVLMRGNGYQAW